VVKASARSTDVLELADVAGPAVRHQPRMASCDTVTCRGGLLGAELLQEVLHQQRHVSRGASRSGGSWTGMTFSR
jgi:hypothetical protein